MKSLEKKRFLTAREARALDERAESKLGVSVLVLMENAAAALAQEIQKILQNRRVKIAVFCGKGNNGGDGFALTRHLLAKGLSLDVFLSGGVSKVRDEARINLEILRRLKQRIVEINEKKLPWLKNRIKEYGVVIDALLGVGLKGDVRGIYRDLIAIINSSDARIVSIDIPSGLDATTGKVLGCCVEADTTVTFVAKKRGMVLGQGRRMCGKIIVRDLGVPL